LYVTERFTDLDKLKVVIVVWFQAQASNSFDTVPAASKMTQNNHLALLV